MAWHLLHSCCFQFCASLAGRPLNVRLEELTMIKHPFRSGVKAQAGVEFCAFFLIRFLRFASLNVRS